MGDGEYWESEYWKMTAQQDLPYLPTPHEVIEHLFLYLSQENLIQKGQKLVDLGAGDGRVIIHAAEKYDIDATGTEINRELIDTTNNQIHEKRLEKKCRILEWDLYDYDVSPYDIVFLFILPSSHKYLKHVISQIKPEALVISIRWPFDTFQEELILKKNISVLEQYSFFIYHKKN